MAHITNKGEQLIRYYGGYSNMGLPDGGWHVVAGRILGSRWAEPQKGIPIIACGTFG